MIKARDWVVFLAHDVPLEELPIPEEHMNFCKKWIERNRSQTCKKVKFSLPELVDQLEYTDWPGHKFHRIDLRFPG